MTTVELISRWAELACEKLSFSRCTFSAARSRLPSLVAVDPPRLQVLPTAAPRPTTPRLAPPEAPAALAVPPMKELPCCSSLSPAFTVSEMVRSR